LRQVLGAEAGRRRSPCSLDADAKGTCLARDCRAHDADHRYVVDGSSLPPTGAPPPTSTIVADASRVGDAIASLVRRGELPR
jgi:choline dehydrogenase-like flavoprotein